MMIMTVIVTHMVISQHCDDNVYRQAYQTDCNCSKCKEVALVASVMSPE